MKKSLIMLLMGLFLLPSGSFADNYETDQIPSHNGFPAKTPAMYYVSATPKRVSSLFMRIMTSLACMLPLNRTMWCLILSRSRCTMVYLPLTISQVITQASIL